MHISRYARVMNVCMSGRPSLRLPPPSLSSLISFLPFFLPSFLPSLTLFKIESHVISIDNHKVPLSSFLPFFLPFFLSVFLPSFLV